MARRGEAACSLWGPLPLPWGVGGEGGAGGEGDSVTGNKQEDGGVGRGEDEGEKGKNLHTGSPPSF